MAGVLSVSDKEGNRKFYCRGVVVWVNWGRGNPSDVPPDVNDYYRGPAAKIVSGVEYRTRINCANHLLSMAAKMMPGTPIRAEMEMMILEMMNYRMPGHHPFSAASEEFLYWSTHKHPTDYYLLVGDDEHGEHPFDRIDPTKLEGTNPKYPPEKSSLAVSPVFDVLEKALKPFECKEFGEICKYRVVLDRNERDFGKFRKFALLYEHLMVVGEDPYQLFPAPHGYPPRRVWGSEPQERIKIRVTEFGFLVLMDQNDGVCPRAFTNEMMGQLPTTECQEVKSAKGGLYMTTTRMG